MNLAYVHFSVTLFAPREENKTEQKQTTRGV